MGKYRIDKSNALLGRLEGGRDRVLVLRVFFTRNLSLKRLNISHTVGRGLQ
jgi:hypothetical protein